MAFQEEYNFTLPRGYKDMDGNLHRNGVMRLANAADEILPLKDQRVVANPAYLSIILLSRVIVKLGDLPAVDTKVIERLYTMDLAYLQELYEEINSSDTPHFKGTCPHCEKKIDIPVNFIGAGQ